jgi:hypothetical protein
MIYSDKIRTLNHIKRFFPWQEQQGKKEENYFHQQIGLMCGDENWTLVKAAQKYLESFQMWR